MTIQEASNVILSQPFRPQEINVSAATPTLPPVVKEPMQPSPQELKAYVNKINQNLKQDHVNLDFSIDKSSKEVVVKVIDSSTGDVLTQFPSKQALAISELLASQKKGSFLNDKA